MKSYGRLVVGGREWEREGVCSGVWGREGHGDLTRGNGESKEALIGRLPGLMRRCVR